SDTLPSSVLKLDSSGVNWAIFSERFEITVREKCLWGHFSGTMLKPQPASTTPTDDEQEKLSKWE
ncbi:hypothetical protein NEOLEDRAFT_1029215, partial [Neolentinus lepideus HHB14362 ss-1]